jgi:hypothetical protein
MVNEDGNRTQKHRRRESDLEKEEEKSKKRNWKK